jgi:hypothetical protein
MSNPIKDIFGKELLIKGILEAGAPHFYNYQRI